MCSSSSSRSIWCMQHIIMRLPFVQNMVDNRIDILIKNNNVKIVFQFWNSLALSRFQLKEIRTLYFENWGLCRSNWKFTKQIVSEGRAGQVRREATQIVALAHSLTHFYKYILNNATEHCAPNTVQAFIHIGCEFQKKKKKKNEKKRNLMIYAECSLCAVLILIIIFSILNQLNVWCFLFRFASICLDGVAFERDGENEREESIRYGIFASFDFYCHRQQNAAASAAVSILFGYLHWILLPVYNYCCNRQMLYYMPTDCIYR